MTTTAGLLLMNRIMPLIAAAIAKGTVKPTGCEDVEELQADGTAIAAQMLDAAERAGKSVPANSVAFYAVQHLRQGRHSTVSGRTDVMAPGTMLDRKASVLSMDEALLDDPEDPTDDMTLHDLLSDRRDDPAVQAARDMDWDVLAGDMDGRQQALVRETAIGYQVNEIAAHHGVSAPRVVQMKRQIGEGIRVRWGSDVLADVVREPAWRKHVRVSEERRAARAARAMRAA